MFFSQTGEVLCVQMEQPACLPIPKDPIILMTVPQFLPFGQVSVFHSSVLLEVRFWCQYRGTMFRQGAQFIHIWMGFQVLAFDISSHSGYAPLQQDPRQDFLEKWLYQYTIFP